MMMLLPKFDFHDPATLEEACQIIGDMGEEAKLLAGGTDLLVNMKKKLLAPANLVSLSRIEPLCDVVPSEAETRIGGCLTAAGLAESSELQETFSALSAGAGVIGSPLIRNRATLAGNLVTARPAADLPPVLMAYNATIHLKSNSGEKSMAAEDFFLGPGETVIAPDEILTHVVLPRPAPFSGAAYLKLGVRQTLEIALVNIAAFITLEGPEGAITNARIAMGSVAPTPIRSPAAEEILMGEKPSEALFTKSGEAATADSKPITDFRASAEYKKDMVAVLTRRALAEAFSMARAGS
jgi:carbon-monoxide dehydrogenase medium subunit